MVEEEGVSRRKYLKYVGAAAAAAIVAGVGYYAYQEMQPKKVKLVFAGTPQGEPYYPKINPIYMSENTNIEIEYFSMPRDEWDAWFKAQDAAGGQIDLIQLEGQFLSAYVYYGLVDDITDIMASDKYSNLKGDLWREDAVATLTRKDRVWGLPLNLVLDAIYYNKGIFEEYNLELPETWEDMVGIAEKLEGTGVLPLMQAGKDVWWNVFYPFTYIVQNTPPGTEADFVIKTVKGEVKYTDPIWLGSLEFANWFMEAGILKPEILGLDYATSISMFAADKAAMFIQGTWFYSEGLKPVASEDWIKKNLGVLRGGPWISAYDGKTIVCNGACDVALSLYKNSKFKEDTLDLMNWIASRENQVKLSEMGYIPSMKGVDIVDPIINAFMEPSPVVHIWPDWIYEPEINTAFHKTIQRMWMGEITPEESAQIIQETQDHLFAEGKSFKDLYA